MSDDTLGELYAWDSTIDDDFARPEDQRDEDESLEAYEGIIYAANPKNESADGVLSLAAMLLTKHFARFPHVQLNVVNALLELCGSAHSQSVRIHSMRSLMQVIKPISTDKAPADIDNTIAWVQRIIEVVGGLGITETSTVILRQMTPLTDALKATMQALQQWKQGSGSSNQQAATPTQSADSPKAGDVRKDREEKDGRSVEFERALKKTKRIDDESSSTASGLRENENTSNSRKFDADPKSLSEPLKSQRGRKDILSRLDMERSSDSTGKATATIAPPKCPPSRFVFIGNIPGGTTVADMADYLADAPDVRAPRVSLRTNHMGSHASMYAFVTLPTIALSRKIIEFVRATPFHGRTLGCHFARGHPVQMVTFVERCDDEDVVDYDIRPFDFENCDGDVWGELMSVLKQYGSFKVIHLGKVCFSSVEDAKNAIRMIYHVLGRDIIPVYDIDEQLPIGGPRMRDRNDSGRQVSDLGFRSGTSDRAFDDRRPRDDDHRRRFDQPDRRGVFGQRDDGRRDLVERRDSRRGEDLPLSSRSFNPPPRITEGNGRHQVGPHSRSPSPKPVRRDSGHHHQDASPVPRLSSYDRRGRSRSPARGSSPPVLHSNRAPAPRDNKVSRHDSFTSRSRSRSPRRDGRAPPDSFDKKRVGRLSGSHSPVDARNKTNEWRRDRASPPRQRDFGAPPRMESHVPPLDTSRRRQDSFDRKDHRDIASNQLNEDRGRPRERDTLDRPRGPPQDMRDGRGSRFAPVSSGPRENRGIRFSPPRHDSGPPRQDAGPPRRDLGPPTDEFRERVRYGPRDEPPPFRNSPVNDRFNGPPRRLDDGRRSRSRTRSRSPGLVPKYGNGAVNSRTPPPLDGRSLRPDDRSDFRPRPSRPDWRPNGPPPPPGRNEQFDRQRPMQPIWNHRENGSTVEISLDRYGPATGGKPGFNTPPRSEDRRPINDGPIRDRAPEKSFQPPRLSQLPPPPRPGDFAPRERRSPPPSPKFQPRGRDNDRARQPESPRSGRQPERRAFDSPPRQASRPRDLSPPPSPLLPRDSSSHRKSEEGRRESREKRRPSESERSDRKRDKDHHKSKERHSNRHEKHREDRHRESKRSRHSERDGENATSPAPSKRARSLTPSPMRRSPQKPANDTKDAAPVRPMVTNDPFDDMDELAVDFEDED